MATTMIPIMQTEILARPGSVLSVSTKTDAAHRTRPRAEMYFIAEAPKISTVDPSIRTLGPSTSPRHSAIVARAHSRASDA